MHQVDQTTDQMVRSVLAHAENRLRMDPVPLDKATLTRRRALRAARRRHPTAGPQRRTRSWASTPR